MLTIDDMQYDCNVWTIWRIACVITGILFLDGRYDQRADLNKTQKKVQRWYVVHWMDDATTPWRHDATIRAITYRFPRTQMTCFSFANVIIVLQLMRYLRLPLASIVWKYLLLSMIPNNIQWRINSTADNAMERNTATFLHIANGVANGFGFWNCAKLMRNWKFSNRNYCKIFQENNGNNEWDAENRNTSTHRQHEDEPGR